MVNGVKTDMVNGRLLLHPAPRSGSGGKQSRSRGASCCARGLSNSEAKTSQTTKGGGGAPKGAYQRPLRAIAASPLGGFAARAPFGGRARLPALYRGSRQDFSLGSVRSRASWQRQRIHSVRHPGSELLADRRRGRPGGFPNRPRMELRTPSRAPLPLASIGRHRLTSLRDERDEILYLKKGLFVNKKVTDAALCPVLGSIWTGKREKLIRTDPRT